MKEDKQIIDRGIKENWRIGDRTRLKRLLEKNLKLCRENIELENKIADIKANCDLAIEGRDVKIMELEQKLEQTEKDLADYQFNYPSIKELSKENAKLKQQIMKMRCCSNCRYKYKYCSWTSETIKDGKRTSHYWNEEKQAYCDVGEGAEYQLWEIKENDSIRKN